MQKNLKLLFSSLSIFIFLSFPNYSFAQPILYGDSVALGNGMVRTFVQVNIQGNRELIGVSMTAGVLNNLDTVSRLFVLNLPVTGDDTLVNHIFFGWNPMGHPPFGVWNVPHFDFHFVTVRRSERESVLPGPDSVLAQSFTPTDHFYDPIGAVPFHGTHWADSTDPAFHGGIFTKTLIYGFYRGKIFFYEPMITRAYLLTNPHDTLIIKQPTLNTRTGRFPTKYSITHNASNQTYNIVMREFLFGEEGGPLPVELSSFVSTIHENDVTLNWTTASEENNARFEIERANGNAQVWGMVGTVQGNGNSTQPISYSFVDRGINVGTYNYRLKQIDFNGNYEYHNLSNEVVVGVPTRFDLSQNYPNPFNPSTSINFDLPFDSKVSIRLFDMSGKEVATLLNEAKTAGYYTINYIGSGLSSGVYFYSISAESNGNNFEATKKMILIK